MADTSADQEPQSTERANVNSGPSTMLPAQSESETREVEVTNAHSDGGESNIDSKAEEVAADSLSNLNADGQSRLRGKARIRRTRSVKAVVEDAKAIYGKSIEFNDAEDGSTGEPGKGASKNGRKRGRVGSLRACTSEQDGNESDGKSDSVTGEHQRGKRRQKVASEEQEVVGQRYNLRRSRRVAGKTALGDKKNEETAGGVQQEDGINCAQTTAAASVGVAVSDNGVTANVVELEGMADSEETDAGSPKRTGESGAASEEDVGNRTPERDGNDSEEDESETEHPGNVSIGKKLWTFLTT